MEKSLAVDEKEMSFESSEKSQDLEIETSRASLDLYGSSTSGVDKEIPIFEGSKGSLNHPQSAVLALRDLYISDSQECDDQSRVSAERAVLNFEAEASRETMVTAGISSPVSHQSSLSAESIEGNLNFEAEASEATMEDVEVSSRMLPPAKNVGFWKYPQSPFSTLLEFHESDSHEGDNSTLPAESSKRFLHLEPQTSIATTGAVRPGKSILSLLKIPGYVSPELNVNFNCDTDLDGRLYSGYCCAYCVRALNRYERISYIYKIRCTIANDERERDDSILKEDNRFNYFTHRCSVQKSTSPSDPSEGKEKDCEILLKDHSFHSPQHRRNIQKWSPPPKNVHCYLCLEHFEYVFAFECHLISQHKKDVIVLCYNCQQYRRIIETFCYHPTSDDPTG